MRDLSSNSLVCWRSFDCQKSVIFVLTINLKSSLLGGYLNNNKGLGKLYVKHRERISENQFLLVCFSNVKSFTAILFKILSFSRQIMQKRVSCFTCSWASPGSFQQEKTPQEKVSLGAVLVTLRSYPSHEKKGCLTLA